ncbi:MAG: hypothetical protein ACKPKO_53335, partial [Candidatus Fonsibacter sp.]
MRINLKVCIHCIRGFLRLIRKQRVLKVKTGPVTVILYDEGPSHATQRPFQKRIYRSRPRAPYTVYGRHSSPTGVGVLTGMVS